VERQQVVQAVFGEVHFISSIALLIFREKVDVLGIGHWALGTGHLSDDLKKDILTPAITHSPLDPSHPSEGLGSVAGAPLRHATIFHKDYRLASNIGL
jgi:hypothetical protein